MSWQALAAAKLNVGLAVTGRRHDGYHTLRSVFLRLVLADELIVDAASDEHGPDALSVSGDPDCVVEDNLVLRATEQLRARIGMRLPPLRLTLRKRVPVGAGLAGGSSDAAAALTLCARAWGVRLRPDERQSLALRLGADVPFFTAGHAAALVRGVGQGLEPIAAPDPPLGVLLVTPPFRLSTAAVFAEHDRITEGGAQPGPPAGSASADLVAGFAALLRASRGPEAIVEGAARLRDGNDLWLAAARLAPSLVALRSRLEAATGRPFLMTGSGTTLFALYPSGSDAAAAARRLGPHGHGPLTGARVLATATASATGGSVDDED
jgi:4-diphosphocytidyl-2-C-methyl-D-erythritol kinase